MALQQERSAKQSNPNTQAKVIWVSADMVNAADIKKSPSYHDGLIAHTRHRSEKECRDVALLRL